ncbi:uncharacterized protein LOC123270842 [Cotesia glomerata]|uniref:uncharacterized protein LOC123270842 n=1 Tax=Cotesia glomerata TaxID=32391 RepID=UPI001D0260EC|nr:uncharacterized protein LOC123270842 [Cotesia glomerata]
MDHRMASKIKRRKKEMMDSDKQNNRAAISKYRSAVRQAILNHQNGCNSSFFEDKIIKNEPIKTTGPFAGYTALHIACMDGDIELVEVLVENYHANVNAVADDGSQPIHLACLFEREMSGILIDILLRAGANVNAEIEQKLFEKYFSRKRWCSDFGNKMTLLTFAILHDINAVFVLSLIRGKANLKVKSLENKTLLMYAIENEDISIALSLIEEVKDHEWINARDSGGYPATHYILNPKNLENNRYLDNENELVDDLGAALLISNLLDAGADVNATINDDPNTLLLNIAARNCFPLTLEHLLPYHDNISKSTALHYILRPLITPQTESSIDRKRTSIKLILKDLIYRRTFGLFVPEDEKISMDKLIAEDINLRELAHAYEKNIIHGELKTKVLKYDDKSITYYDFIMSCCDDKQLRLIVKNKSLIDAFENTFPNPALPTFTREFMIHPNFSDYSMDSFNADYFFFRKQISIRIEKTSRRLEQLEALKRVKNLRKAIPLPYELIKERKKRLDINKHNMHAAIDKYLLAMRAAISNHQKGRNSSFFEDIIINNEPIEMTGPFAGYTALHLSCMDGNIEFVRLLVDEYHANVNAVADDGSQPIHFACLFECEMTGKLIDILLKAGANVDAEIGKNLFTKYIKCDKWRNDFGNNMTLLTYSILYGCNNPVVISLVRGGANLKVMSQKNKTLIMYAIEDENEIASLLITQVHDYKWLNIRDNDGYPATHYALNLKNLENGQYCHYNNDLWNDMFTALFIRDLLNAGADVNATINDDPNTLLLNIAARLHFPLTLDHLLPYHDKTSKSTALHYVLRPLKTLETQFNIDKRRTSIKLILKNLIYRRTFGLFIPADEKISMDKLIAEDINLRELAHAYEKNIIQGELKTKVLKYDDKSITYYDFIMSCFDDIQIRLIVKNKSLIDAFKNTFPNPNVPSFVMEFRDRRNFPSYSMESFNADYFFLRRQILIRIEKTSRKVEQLEALKKIENLRKAIPLPYELAFYL